MRRLLILPAALVACAPAPVGVQGGIMVPYSRFTRKAEQVYTAGSCRDSKGGPVSSPDEVEYELHRDGDKVQFVEHALSEGEARLMNNRWVDGGEVHYFVWLKGVRGFEYIIPQDPSRPALRRIYRNPQLRAVKDQGQVAVQPLGQPDIVCELLAMR